MCFHVAPVLLTVNLPASQAFCIPQVPYSNAHFKVAMQSGEYICGGNFFWQDLDNDSEMQEVPISTKRVESLVAHYFDRPRPVPGEVSIALKAGQQVTGEAGKLHVISPIEFSHAFLFALHKACVIGAEQVLLDWKRVALMTSFRFIVCEGEDAVHYQSKQLRENIGANYFGVRMSAIAKVYELMKFRNRKEQTTGKLSNKALAKLYADNVKFSEMNDNKEVPTCENFIENAAFIHKVMLSNPRTKALLLDADEANFANPLDSVSKLSIVGHKAKGAEEITWTIELILDYCKAGAITAEQVGTRTLEGKLSGQNGKGLVDLCLFKKNLLSHFVTRELPKFDGWGNHVHEQVRQVLANISSFRDKSGYMFSSSMPKPDQIWRAGWPKSADAFMSFVESCIFWYHYDAPLRTAMINRKDCASLCNQAPISDMLDEIKSTLAEETDAKKDHADGAGAASGDAKKGTGDDNDDDVAIIDVISLETNPEIKKLVEGFDAVADTASKQKLESYMTQCRRLIASNITLLVETDPDDVIIEGIRKSAAAQVKLEPGGMIGVFYDVKLAGEASAQPNVRMPPLRDLGHHLQKLVGLKLRASSVEGEIPANEIWFIPDAGKEGNKGALLAGFTAGKQKEVRPLLVIYDETSLEDRLDKLRGY